MTISRFKNHRGEAILVALRIPVFGCNAFSVTPFIFLHKKTVTKLDAYKYKTMLDHEMVYIHLQRLVGRWTYFRKYAHDLTFRYLVELRAYTEDLRFLLYTCGRDQEYAIREISEILSSKEYGHMVTEDRARVDLLHFARVAENERIMREWRASR